MSSIIAQLYSNNEIRLRLISRPPSKAKGSKRVLAPVGKRDFLAEVSPANLDIIREFQRPKRSKLKSGWGLYPRRTRFGAKPRHMLLEAGAVVDKTFGTNALFLTGTLPGSTQNALWGICLYSGYIVNRLQQWLRRKLGDLHSFYAWELQKRGALHIHYVCASGDRAMLETIQEGFKAQWVKILKDVCRKSGLDLFEKDGKRWSWIDEESIQADAQFITKSCAAYVSKYVGKGANERHKGFGSLFRPARWWGCTRPLRHKVLQSRDTLESGFGDYERQFERFQEIGGEISKLSVCAYPMSDRWHPDNRTLIMYFPPEFLSGTWEILSDLLTRNACLLEAHLTVTKRKVETPAWDEIKLNYRRRRRAIDEALQSELYSAAWNAVSRGRGWEVCQEYECTWLELWELHCQSWLSVLRRIC